MVNFYGGPQGRSFEIAKVFSNYTALIADLNNIDSSIGVGSYVLISYGNPNTDEYQTNEKIDAENYNCTLYKKGYYGKNEPNTVYRNEEAQGYGYKLIASIVAAPTHINIEHEVLKPDGVPDALVEQVNNNATVTFKLPKSWQFNTNEVKVVAANETVVASCGKNADGEHYDLKIHVPKSWKFDVNGNITQTKPETTPTVTLKENVANAQKTFEFTMPKPWGVEAGAQVVGPQTQPSLETETISGETKKFIFNLPKAWQFTSDVSASTPKQGAEVAFTTDETQGIHNIKIRVPNAWDFKVADVVMDKPNTAAKLALAEDATGETKTFTFTLPKNWDISSVVPVQAVSPLVNPEANVTTLEDGETKQISMSLPKAWQFELGTVTLADAGTEPTVSLTQNVDGTIKYINFTLPKGQRVNTDVIANVLGSLENPTVSMTNNPNKPQLTFNLPRSAHFYYGDLLGNNPQPQPYQKPDTDFPDAKEGDFYINRLGGFMYQLTAYNASNKTWTLAFIACLSGMGDVFTGEVINTYDADGALQHPQVDLVSYDYPDIKAGGNYNIKIPRVPDIASSYTEVGSADTGGVTSTKQASRLTFNFKVPRGARFFAGTEVNDDKLNAVITGAKNGDLYIYSTNDETDAYRGIVYQYNGTSWIRVGSILGPVGNALNIKQSISFSAADGEDTLENISTKLAALYPNGIDSDELLAVTYSSSDKLNSYWYYYVNGAWGRVLLTGGLSSLLLNSYDGTNSQLKTYSVKYINTLIQNEVVASEKERKTYSAKAIEEKIATAKSEVEEIITWGNLKDLI